MPPISRPASATYWYPPTMRPRRLSELPQISNGAFDDLTHSSSNSSSRNYIDPWDLENYAYMKRHVTDDSEYLTATPALESSQSDFYYVPNYQNEGPYYSSSRFVHPDSMMMTDESIGLFAGVEEEDFYNERYELPYKRSPLLNSKHRYQTYIDVESRYRPRPCLYPPTDGDSYEDEDMEMTSSEDDRSTYRGGRGQLDYQLYSPSVLLRRPKGELVYVYETGGRGRKMALPRGNFSDPSGMEDGMDVNSLIGDTTSAYDDVAPCSCHLQTPAAAASASASRFGLNKQGHLQIDYEYSWDSLNRYIATD